MSDTEKTYTLEEMHAWQRLAFVDGTSWAFGNYADYHHLIEHAAQCEAERLYAPPKKLREVETGGFTYRFREGALEWQNYAGRWRTHPMGASDIRAIADLIEQPHEEDK